MITTTTRIDAPMAYDQIVRAVGPFELSECVGYAAIYGSLAITAPFRTAGKAEAPSARVKGARR